MAGRGHRPRAGRLGHITIVCDNTIDIFLADQGPARRLMSRLSGGPAPPVLPAPTFAEGTVIDSPSPSTASPPTSP